MPCRLLGLECWVLLEDWNLFNSYGTPWGTWAWVFTYCLVVEPHQKGRSFVISGWTFDEIQIFAWKFGLVPVHFLTNYISLHLPPHQLLWRVLLGLRWPWVECPNSSRFPPLGPTLHQARVCSSGETRHPHTLSKRRIIFTTLGSCWKGYYKTCHQDVP